MQIADDRAVLIQYKVSNDGGEVLDSSEGEPLAYIQGQGEIVPGLEQALLGKSAGDKVQVTVQPGDGYGEWDEDKVQTVPRIGVRRQRRDPGGHAFPSAGRRWR